MEIDNIPWVEKYRPKTMENIVLDTNNKIIFSNLIKNHNFPNLLLYGPPGTGKTTTIINLINEYHLKYYNKIFKETIIHLNASDDRGIETIRDQIYRFVETKTFHCIGRKFVILDEVDYMTIPAQKALKFIIENNINNVVFILICNYITKINITLQNMFLNIRFNELPKENILNLLKLIRKNENLNMSNNQLSHIQKIYCSDIRSMINYMQCNPEKISKIIEKDIKHVFNSFITKDNYNECLHYISSLVTLYNIPNYEILTKICEYFVIQNIEIIEKEDISFFKIFFHKNIEFNIISKLLINIIFKYMKN